MATGQYNTAGSGDLLEKDISNGADNSVGPNAERAAALQTIRTANSVSISPELFEKLYLSPQNVVRGDLRKTFGNPTPV